MFSIKNITFLCLFSLSCQNVEHAPPAPNVLDFGTPFTQDVEANCSQIYQEFLEYQNLNYPRTIYVDPKNVTAEYAFALREAVKLWENKLNFYDLFNIIYTEEKFFKSDCGSIKLRIGNLDQPFLGVAVWSKCEANITILTGVKDVKVFAHELGHTINLRHEEDDTPSIMYPYNMEGQVISELSECLVQTSIENFMINQSKKSLPQESDVDNNIGPTHTCVLNKDRKSVV